MKFKGIWIHLTLTLTDGTSILKDFHDLEEALIFLNNLKERGFVIE
jgi:hypothetical protein